MLKRGFQERTLLGTSLTHYKPRAHHPFETPEVGDLNGNGNLGQPSASRASTPLGTNAITAASPGGVH
jgi:hypothetical protein